MLKVSLNGEAVSDNAFQVEEPVQKHRHKLRGEHTRGWISGSRAVCSMRVARWPSIDAYLKDIAQEAFPDVVEMDAGVLPCSKGSGLVAFHPLPLWGPL